MRSEETQFFSDGLRLDARFFLPDDFDDRAAEPQPIIVACSGFTGLCAIHPARFARYLTERSRLCFGFDYRGFGESEGDRGRVVLEDQIRDIVHAIAFVASDPRVDANRIVLLGWGMAGGMILDAAREFPGIAGLIAANGFFNGKRVQIAHRGEQGYRRFVEELERHREHRVRTGERVMTGPFDLYPLDPLSRAYVDDVLRKQPKYDAEAYSWELGESLIRFDVEAFASRLAAPLLIAHGDQNQLHPTTEAESLYETYVGPKELFLIKGAGHTEFMHDDDPKFQALGAAIDDWLARHLD